MTTVTGLPYIYCELFTIYTIGSIRVYMAYVLYIETLSQVSHLSQIIGGAYERKSIRTKTGKGD